MFSSDMEPASPRKGVPSFCYRDLVVWQRSMRLCKRIYGISEGFPNAERFGITAQMRRAAVSIPSNIAEGQGRLNVKEFRQFLGIARGSLRELETQTFLAQELGYVDSQSVCEVLGIMEEVSRMLNKLITKLGTDL